MRSGEIPADFRSCVLSDGTWVRLSNQGLTSVPEWVRGLSRVVKLDVYGNQLTELPAWLCDLTGLTELDVSNNELAQLPAGIGRLSSLTWLNLRDNQITALPESTGDLLRLAWLNARGNELASLPESIGGLVCLAELDLASNKLSSLPDSIGQLTRLAGLNLSDNGLASLPESIGGLASLTELDLGANSLTSLPEAIGRLGALTMLSLDGNKLSMLPESVGNLTALTHLNLNAHRPRRSSQGHSDTWNWRETEITLRDARLALARSSVSVPSVPSVPPLTSQSESGSAVTDRKDSTGRSARLRASSAALDMFSGPEFGSVLSDTILRLLPEDDRFPPAETVFSLPESIVRLTGLRELRMAGTQLERLPEGIGDLGQLNELDLAGTRLAELPDSIGRLAGLTRLDLSRTALTDLPDGIGALTQLTELSLAHTGLLRLPPAIGGLTSLNKLNLSGIRMKGLPAAIGDLASLVELDLTGAAITALPESIGNLGSLEQLLLSNSKISELPDAIGNLTSLRTLDLKKTSVKSMPESLDGLSSLEKLSFQGSKIASLPESVGDLTELVFLDLNGSQLSELPESIGCLTKLRYLGLGDTKLTALPGSIGYLVSLVKLNLDNAKVVSLPESIGNLTRLSWLGLHDAPVTGLPESVGNLTSLRWLGLRGTSIAALPDSIGNLASLTELDLRDTPLTALPDSIGNLTSLTWMGLRGTGITTLPQSIGNLSGLTELVLSLTQIACLPDSIGNLTSLMALDLAVSQLTALPESIGNLTALTWLGLAGCPVTELPASIGNLTSLTTLVLRGTQLATLPEPIGDLIALQDLDARDAPLTALPASVGNLSELTKLTLAGTRLTSLPDSIGGLTALQELDLRDVPLKVLPAPIGNLSRLTRLVLAGTQLKSLPARIGSLSALSSLDLSDTGVTLLPDSVGDLSSLKELDVRNGGLAALPQEIGNLTGLTLLDLTGNRLRQLPSTLAQLLRLKLQIKLDGNPLDDPLPALRGMGASHLATYLDSLVDARPQYEAKLLLVGEGNVGKSSLVAALLGERFVRDRPTTHGIEISPIQIRQPSLKNDITLRAWDFGGQEVYRVTHQFFFSHRALYIIAWKPREGQEENQVEGWLRRIRLRVGPGVRTMVVATHSAERIPELDYPQLEHLFPRMLVGNFEIDSHTGAGIPELLKAIGAHAARLPHMGQLISPRWTAARDEILALAKSKTQIRYAEFVEICCERHDMSGPETVTLAKLMHDLGHVIYYGEDEGLKDIVVLNPEWLTKAISYVLEDRETREAGGVLEHARLRKIWLEGPDGNAYPVEYHPYFLRLMEKFDVCYRLEGDDHRSLVAQLVPHRRPKLPWQPGDSPSPGTRRLVLVCKLSEPVTGLIPWITVRQHRAATGLHWRRGMFLRHPIAAYKSEAILELRQPNELVVEVRAPSPIYYFSVLRDSIEDLIARRWPGLSYKLLVPCHGVPQDNSPCQGLFPLEGLLKVKENGSASSVVCMECAQMQDVSALLIGYDTPGLSIGAELQEIHEQLDRMESGILRVDKHVADTADSVRRVMQAIGAQVADCPRLFTLKSDAPKGLRRAKVYQEHSRLTLWCEHHGYWHPWAQATYQFDYSKEWFSRIRPYAVLVIKTLQLVVPLAGSIAVTSLPSEQIERADAQLEAMKTMLDDFPDELGERAAGDAPTKSVGELTVAEGQALRALRALLMEKDPVRSFGGLRQVFGPAGEVLWVCPDHYPDYDPGLPIVP